MNAQRIATAGLVAGLLALAGPAQQAVYRVETLRGSLVRLLEDRAESVARGAELAGGDRLRTGHGSQAELVVEAAAARFAIGPRTTFRLAGSPPGVLLELERGRLSAVFERLTGGPGIERVVTTPSAVLAVRGTTFAVEVSKRGDTTLVVFEGTVEVWEPERRGAPVLVRARERVRVRMGQPPGPVASHRLSLGDWQRTRSPAAPRGSAAPASPDPQRGGGSPGRRGGVPPRRHDHRSTRLTSTSPPVWSISR